MVLLIDGFLAVGGVAATQDGSSDSAGVQPHSRRLHPRGPVQHFFDTVSSTTGVIVESVPAILGNGSVAVDIGDTGGLSDEHTAHILRFRD